MFEAAQLGHAVDKATFKNEEARLREGLLAAQLQLRQRADFPVVILLAGVPAAGKGETANLLLEWMDPRSIATHAFDTPSDEETARPPFWRFWRILPPKGNIAVLFGGWYADPLWHWQDGDEERMAQRIERIQRLEKMLADEGVLVLKFWLHLSRDKLKQRLKGLQADPRTAWRVTPEDKRFLKDYDRRIATCRTLLTRTNLAEAPWRVVEGWDANYRALSVCGQVLDALGHQLARESVKQRRVDAAPLVKSIDGVRLLDALRLEHPLAKPEYRDRLALAQGRFHGLMRSLAARRLSMVAVFEGMDAAGKGGAIRRVTAALDARQYRVVPIAAPTDEEMAQPYLWRFWRHVPPYGRLTVFDRSWYGRVLVERIEGYAAPAEWMRAYDEINDFEAQLTDAGVVVVKFWLAISQDEQLRRFQEREATGYKRFKITDEDWRNREKWDDYIQAASDMVERTNTPEAPWHLIGADNKYHARIAVLDAMCEALARRLKRED
ncbi:polyphosphate:AMP phosphotransferase [Chitiniphilus purpureus]|uniref:Polyphosphate:AMP phosphotransferase n=1 Tax=Chitiniphilus purpureus TaxID=2981137 RepID=A0ABY6DR88_9NEIS|nr:polyphosphate:AMP phosphotransferase [Chitiniphilus sp. CD1]UXY16876.1 polyphosphate:AMP phosphotransferase [Chitiniphilus sp. CD1]